MIEDREAKSADIQSNRPTDDIRQRPSQQKRLPQPMINLGLSNACLGIVDVLAERQVLCALFGFGVNLTAVLAY